MNFIENRGQIIDMNNQLRPDILFVGDGGGSKVYLRKTGYSIVMTKLESPEFKVLSLESKVQKTANPQPETLNFKL